MEKTFNLKFVSLWLALICIAVFVIQLLSSSFTYSFMLTPNALEKPWQFLTAVFLHGSPAHLIYNLFALIMFGLVLESILGSKRYLLFYLASGILANVLSFIFNPNINALGASGAIMAVIGVVAILKPKMVVWTYNLPLPMFIVAIIWVAGSILGLFGLGDQTIGHSAHLSGIVLGILYGFFLRLTRKTQRTQRKENSTYYETRFNIPESEMRRWEDWNLR